jgi:hypothetical protein
MDYQEIMKKYAKLVAKKLYDIENFSVEFDYHLWDETDGYDLGGRNDGDVDGTIYFNDKLFDVNHIEESAWLFIVHEVTHFKVWGHGDDFKDELGVNLEKVDDLRKEFNKEVSWDEDFIYEDE